MFVTQLARDVQTLPDHGIRGSIISLLAGEHAGGKKRSRPRFGRSGRACQFEHFAQLVAALHKILAHLPVAKQGRAETQAPCRVSGFGQPLQSGSKIVMFESHVLQPIRHFPGVLFRSFFFRQDQAVGGVGTLRQSLLTAGFQLLERVFVDGLQHNET